MEFVEINFFSPRIYMTPTNQLQQEQHSNTYWQSENQNTDDLASLSDYSQSGSGIFMGSKEQETLSIEEEYLSSEPCSNSEYLSSSKNSALFDVNSDKASCTSVSTKSSTKKSSLHNMQKHLFTFVVSELSKQNQRSSFNDESDLNQIEKCAEELLNILKSEKRKTKESLLPIFGEYDERKMMNSPQYSYIVEKYCRSTLLCARDLLKEKIIEKLSFESIATYLKRSKVTKKSEFQEYLKSFRQQMLENNFGCRITQKSQKKIREETEWTKVLDLN